ncbi:MAG: TolC family protein [Pseudomonadota bacterium]|nr:TolC family protein [Pseudomonadota bacterium]
MPSTFSNDLPKRFVTATFSLSLVLAVAGCATPRLQSTVDLAAKFAGAPTTSEPDVVWWERYEDPVLSGLISRAALENRDIRMAVERVRSARAGETISRSVLLPSISAVSNANSSGNGYSGGARQAAPKSDGIAGGLSVSWELDLSGRLRAGAAAAAADAQASVDEARGVRLLVLTDVASNYFTLTGALQQVGTVRAISSAQDETLRLVSARERVGLASSFDVERARTEAERARAAIPPLETLVAVSRHRLAVLIGSQASASASLQPWTGAVAVPAIKPGQPAALLERRPDLLALSAQLDAANWRRQQAKAEWFPRLFLGAMFGRQSMDVNGLDLGAAHFSNVAATLAMPLLDWGRTRSINEIAESNQKQALLRYENAIVRALEDVENALVALADERDRSRILDSAAGSAQAALGHAESLYRRGQIDLLPLLDAQRARLAVQINANDSRTQALLDSVLLFKALGGGWQAFEREPPAVAAPAETSSPVSTTKESS